MEYCYIVYKTTNKINGKVYVGVHKTVKGVDDTYIGCGVYKKDLKKSRKSGFPAAVRKYGYSNFVREILFTYPDSEEGYKDAYKKEADIVNTDWVKSDNNYNLVPGGRGSLKYSLEKPINRYDLEGNFLDTWPSIKNASEYFDITASTISNCCNRKYKTAGKFQWRFISDVQDVVNIAINCKTVYQFDLQGNLLKTWPSITIASKQFSSSESARVCISNVCNKKKKYHQAFGYYWSYNNKFEYEPSKDTRTAVACYDIDGTFINSFSSISDAARFYNISSGNIIGVIKGFHKTCNNLRWRYFYGNWANIKPLT